MHNKENSYKQFPDPSLKIDYIQIQHSNTGSESKNAVSLHNIFSMNKILKLMENFHKRGIWIRTWSGKN